MHGAGGGQPSGASHPNFRHGLRTKSLSEMRALIRLLKNAGAEAINHSE
jgi:hypothetical protein